MAEKGSWSDLLADFIRGFIFLRDVFGYILPGLVFLLIGVCSGHVPGFEGFQKICDAGLPIWMAVLLVLIFCYVTGHFLIATVYCIPDAIRLFKKQTSPDPEASDLLRYRSKYPDIFIELDRRSILALLRNGLAGSVILGLAVFYWLYPYPRFLMAAAGAIMLFNASGADRHIRQMRKITLRAAQEADKESAEPPK